MKIKVLGSTKMGYEIPKDVALDFSAKMAGICYMPDRFEDILAEPMENTQKRVNQTLKSGHHSVYDHVTLNLLFTGIPKILAMILNNEGMYTTSEKSARYTKMKPSPREKELYDKWHEIFAKKIAENYEDRFYKFHFAKLKVEEKAAKAAKTQIGKLAQENARYMISVFTPTTMAYSVSLRQLNYLRSFFEKFIEEDHDYLPVSFVEMLKDSMKSFLEETSQFYVEHLDAKVKSRGISLFDTRTDMHTEYFGEVYATTYEGTFAELAQAQRHRTLRYKMKFSDEARFYVPKIIEDDESLVNEWLTDIKSVAEVYPQGMMIEIFERGTYEDFVLKCMERLCGCAQLEIANQTAETMKKYIDATSANPESGVYKYLSQYNCGARCKFENWKCAAPCVWGAKDAFSRKI